LHFKSQHEGRAKVCTLLQCTGINCMLRSFHFNRSSLCIESNLQYIKSVRTNFFATLNENQIHRKYASDYDKTSAPFHLGNVKASQWVCTHKATLRTTPRARFSASFILCICLLLLPFRLDTCL
jgi:hypothetical protein